MTEEKEYISSPTSTTTTTSGQAIRIVFGPDSELLDITNKRDKKNKYCKFCKKWFSSWHSKCPICDTKLEEGANQITLSDSNNE